MGTAELVLQYSYRGPSQIAMDHTIQCVQKGSLGQEGLLQPATALILDEQTAVNHSVTFVRLTNLDGLSRVVPTHTCGHSNHHLLPSGGTILPVPVLEPLEQHVDKTTKFQSQRGNSNQSFPGQQKEYEGRYVPILLQRCETLIIARHTYRRSFGTKWIK